MRSPTKHHIQHNTQPCGTYVSKAATYRLGLCQLLGALSRNCSLCLSHLLLCGGACLRDQALGLRLQLGNLQSGRGGCSSKQQQR